MISDFIEVSAVVLFWAGTVVGIWIFLIAVLGGFRD